MISTPHHTKPMYVPKAPRKKKEKVVLRRNQSPDTCCVIRKRLVFDDLTERKTENRKNCAKRKYEEELAIPLGVITKRWSSDENASSRIYTEDYLVVATTITSARLLSSQCKHGEIVRLLSSRARLSSRRYSRQNVSSDGHLRYLRKLSDQCKFGRLL